MILFIKLLLAHLIGDFIVQPDSWVRSKETKTFKSPYLYLHGLIHFVLILLITWDLKMLPYAGLIAVSHIIIDIIKLELQKSYNKRWFFTVDQLLHLLVLAAVAYYIARPSIVIDPVIGNQVLILVTGFIFLLTPSSVIIKIFLSKWAPATEIKTDKIETQSLQHAGKMIGYLERILILIFILEGQWAAIGFLVTAKSVFRFSDLKIGQDRKLTEYILIGTLLSFGIAIIVGIIVRMLTTVSIIDIIR